MQGHCDLDLWPSDMKINMGHLLIMNKLLKKFEEGRLQRSLVIARNRSSHSRSLWPWPLIIWPKNQIRIIYFSRKTCLSRLRNVGLSVHYFFFQLPRSDKDMAIIANVQLITGGGITKEHMQRDNISIIRILIWH